MHTITDCFIDIAFRKYQLERFFSCAGENHEASAEDDQKQRIGKSVSEEEKRGMIHFLLDFM